MSVPDPSHLSTTGSDDVEAGSPPRRRRADARRNEEALLDAARDVFADLGVDAPARAIADRAGVGVGTMYRHFPKRSDLVKAVFRREVDACADAAADLRAAHEPLDALTRWLERFTEFLAAKRGLVGALHSGDPAFDELPGYFQARLHPTLDGLLDDARGAGAIRDDVGAEDLLFAVTDLSRPADGPGARYSARMLGLLVDGLRHGARGG